MPAKRKQWRPHQLRTLPALGPEGLCSQMRKLRQRGRPCVWQLRGEHPQCGGCSKPGTQNSSLWPSWLPPHAQCQADGSRGQEWGGRRGGRRQEELWALALGRFPAVETPAPTSTGTGTLAWVLGKRIPHSSLREQPRNGVRTLLGLTWAARS